jgi:hypothetical protein
MSDVVKIETTRRDIDGLEDAVIAHTQLAFRAP